jgi:hypothetical protein
MDGFKSRPPYSESPGQDPNICASLVVATFCGYCAIVTTHDEVNRPTDEVLSRATQWVAGRYGYPQGTVVEIEPNGSDWEGSTEDGYHSAFDVTLVMETPKGRVWERVEGEDMQSLWLAVVRGDGRDGNKR